LLRKKVTIINKLGLHARASAKLVHLASRYASEILLIKKDQKVNGKSIMGVMMLSASRGVELELEVGGEDEVVAIAAVEELILNRFGEEE
jgi:phosphocarrier protein HPr